MLQSSSSTLQLDVVDTCADRKDLAERREIKFIVQGADVQKLAHKLEVNCTPVVHNKTTSVVRSIYFDDAQLSACYANLNGLGVRQKLRLRWYDSLQPMSDAFIEIKWRRNRTTGKHRAQLSANQPFSEVCYRDLLQQLRQVLPTTFHSALAKYDEPVVLVEYKRRHFISPDRKIRLTIDFDLKFYDQTSRKLIHTRFPRPLHDLVIVEAKTPLGFENELRALLYPFTARAGGCSKYVHGCQLLNLIHSRIQ